MRARAAVVWLAGVIVMGACSGGGGGVGGGSPTVPPAGTAGGPAGGGSTGGAGGGSAAPQDSCAGLAPSFGLAVEALVDAGAAGDCAFATTNPDGQVALGIANTSGIAVDLRSPANTTLGTIQVLTPVPFGGGSRDVDPWFHWSSSGYHAIVYDLGAFPPLAFRAFRAYDASGLQLVQVGQFAISSAPDGQGGSVLLAQDWQRTVQASGRSHAPQYVPSIGPMMLEWVDAAGSVTRSATIDGDPSLVLVNPGTGHVVAISLGAAAQARWFDATGQPLTPWFTIGDVVGTSIHLLVDGTVVVRDAGRWDVALQDGVSNPVAVPDWLAARPFTRLATVRGGRGYAVLPDGTGADASQFEIVTASGQSCGTFAVPAPTVTATGSSMTSRLEVGPDGTLLQQLSRTVVPNSGGGQCAFRWWPALLR